MYRDEKEALEARRDALKRESAEVDARLQEIKDHKESARPSAARTPRGVYITAFMIVLSVANLLGLLAAQSHLQKQMDAIEADTSVCEEYGILSLEPEQMARELEDIFMDAPCNESAEPTACEFDYECGAGKICSRGWCSRSCSAAACDGAENNCAATDGNDLEIIFILDTSGSMTPYLESIKQTIGRYAQGSSTEDFLILTASEPGRGAHVVATTRGEISSALSEVQINHRIDEEPIPALMELGAVSSVNSHRYLVVAYTDETPQPVRHRTGTLCSPPYNATFVVFTTPQNVRAWQELGSCIRVYGDL